MNILNPFGLDFLEALQPILAVIATGLLVFILWRIGMGTLQTGFVHFTVGTALVGISQIILITKPHFTVGIQTWWHLMFLLGMISFVWGGIRLKQTSYKATAGSFRGLDLLVVTTLVLLAAVIVYVSGSVVSEQLEMFLAGSVIGKYGLHHILITVLAISLVVYMVTLEHTWEKLLKIDVYPIIVFVSLMGAQHFLEIVAHVSPGLEKIVDVVSEITVIVAFVIFIFGLLRFILSD